MTTAVITGATGLVGRRLLDRLGGARVLSRNPGRAAGMPGVVAHGWDPIAEPAPAAALDDASVVFHLAGEPVAEGRWTESKKRSIRDSRVVGTRNLVAGLATLPRRPQVLVSASAVGIYGDRGDARLTEDDPAGTGFLADVCRGWEQEARGAEALGIRTVIVRIGIVLAEDGGALARMVPPFKLGVGGRLGSGRQWMPWIHLDDLVGILLHAAHTEGVSGVLNAVAPEPVTNAEFTQALADTLHRPALLPVPRFAVRALFGEMSEIMFASQRALPERTRQSGYRFSHEDLRAALADVLRSGADRAA